MTPTHCKSVFDQYVEQTTQQENTTAIFAEKISCIKAEQIQLVAMILIFKIPPNLGPIEKVKIEQKVMQTKKPNFNPLGNRECMMLMMHQNLLEQINEQESGEFFSEKEFGEFTMLLLDLFKTYVEEAFSTPSNFLDYGMVIHLSDYDPDEVLVEACKKMGIGITAADIPRKYFVQLELDRKLSREQSTLVFAIKHWSDGVKFCESTFTIERLEKENNNAFRDLT